MIANPKNPAHVEATAPASSLLSSKKQERLTVSPGAMLEVWPWEKKENSPAVADRRKKKEGTDTKQLRLKADQAVSSVSAALSLVNSINLLLKRRLR